MCVGIFLKLLRSPTPFPSSNGYTHILVVGDYVTKWVEAIPTSSADHNTAIKMLKLFSRGLESLDILLLMVVHILFLVHFVNS